MPQAAKNANRKVVKRTTSSTTSTTSTTPTPAEFYDQARALVADLNAARDRFREGATALLAARPEPADFARRGSDLPDTLESFARGTLDALLYETSPEARSGCFLPWQANGGAVTVENLRAEFTQRRDRDRAEEKATRERRKAKAAKEAERTRKSAKILRAAGVEIPSDPHKRAMLTLSAALSSLELGVMAAREYRSEPGAPGPILDVRDALPAG